MVWLSLLAEDHASPGGQVYAHVTSSSIITLQWIIDYTYQNTLTMYKWEMIFYALNLLASWFIWNLMISISRRISVQSLQCVKATLDHKKRPLYRQLFIWKKLKEHGCKKLRLYHIVRLSLRYSTVENKKLRS